MMGLQRDRASARKGHMAANAMRCRCASSQCRPPKNRVGCSWPIDVVETARVDGDPVRL